MKTIILDRDGVINQDSDAYIKSPEEWVPIPGSLEAIAKLSQAGYHILVATNQSGVSRGLFDAEVLAAIHNKMENAIQSQGGKLDGIYYCPHTPDENCSCRKPKPGLLLKIQEDLNLDLHQTIMVGDSLKDLQAAVAVGAKPVLVLTGKGTKTVQQLAHDQQVDTYRNLAHYIDTLLAKPSLN